jgi:8-amino-7-oxononanoate synthase
VQTLAAQGARFMVDKLAHASIIDAVRATGSELRVFPHNQFKKLQRLLDDAPAAQLQVVLTESIFSMDGDAADLAGLAELKKRRPFVLVLDEAHATGVYGKHGAGYANERGLQSVVDVSVVTLSKALGVIGGAVCGSRAFCESLVNHGRAYIFSTSIPAHVARGAQAAIEVLRDEPHRQRRVREVAMKVRQLLCEKFAIIEGDSPIIPIVIGSEEAALSASEKLREKGLLVIAVRPPTVPRGSSRLRVTLSCEHKDDEINDRVVALHA